MTIRISCKPVNITIIQIYAPTSTSDEEVTDKFYESLQDVMDKAHKGDVLLIMGDFNAKVGEGAEGRTVGKFGLEIRNESGDKLIDLSKTNNMVITNTQFKQHKRRLYT